jgi:hypothetical protein
MYRWLIGLCIIILSVPFGIAYGIKTGEVEIGQNGIYDGVVKISRDGAGNLLFQDSEVTTPVLLKDLGHGVEHHSKLQGLSGDDHLQYLTSGRHEQAHIAAFNDALAISPDVGNNTTLGSHVQDSDIHLQRGEAEQISGNWVFSGATEFYAPVHFSNNGGTGSQALEFEAGAEDATIEWNATAERFELNKGLSAPLGEFALGKSTEMEVLESLSGRDAAGNPVAVIDGFSQIEGIQAQNLLDKSADEDVNGQWDFLKNMRVTQTLSSLSSYLWAMSAELTSTSDDTENRSGLNRAGLMASSHFSNQGSGDVTYSWNVGMQGEGRSTGKSASGEAINDFGVVGKGSSESALTNVIGVAGFGDLYSTNRSRIGVYGGLDSSVMGNPESLPTGEWAGYFAGNVHATGTLSGDGSGLSGVELKKAQVVTVAKSGGDFSSIQAAIDSITDSGPTKAYVVLVHPGVYSEKVTLNKNYVSLIGVQANGAKVSEAQNSGAIVTYESSGVGTDLMTMLIASGGATDLKGITVANLTIINTQAFGVGGAQEAIDIGRGDTAPRAHEILIKNCSLYGEQDTVFVNTGNPIFQDCYIDGWTDVLSIGSSTLLENVFVYSRTTNTADPSCIWIGASGDPSFTVTFRHCLFDKVITATQGGVGRWGSSNATANFYQCSVLPNAATACWNENSKTGTVNLYATNGKGWPETTNFLTQEQLNIANGKFIINKNGDIQCYGPLYTENDAEIRSGLTAKSPVVFNWDDEPAYFKVGYGINEAAALDLSGLTDFTLQRVLEDNGVSTGIMLKVIQETVGAAGTATLIKLENAGTAIGNFLECYSDGTERFRLENDGDAFVKGGLNVGMATGAGTGDAKLSGDLTVSGGDVNGVGSVNLDLGEAIANRIVGTCDRLRITPIGSTKTQIEWIGGTGNAAFNVFDDTANATFEITNSSGTYVANAKVEGFISTNGKEFLAHDIVRHTVSAGEATAGSFTEAWSTAAIAKVVAIHTALNDVDTVFRNEAAAGMSATYDGEVISVSEGSVAWAANDIVTITILYEN